jgi:hypothetical protein
MAAALAAVESGDASAIVVAKLDRLSRSLVAAIPVCPKPSEGVVLARGNRTFEDRRTFISYRTSLLGAPSPHG